MKRKSKKETTFALTCLSIFFLMVALTFYPIIIPDKIKPIESVFLYIFLYSLEFIFITPLYVIFVSKWPDMGLGRFSLKQFLLLILMIIFIQLACTYILDVKKPESWTIAQGSIRGSFFWLNFFMLVFIVPVYEELVFRGGLLTSLIIFSRGGGYLYSITDHINIILHVTHPVPGC